MDAFTICVSSIRGKLGNFFVGSTQLFQQLLNDDQSYTCIEAIGVDELIFYFVPTHYFKLPDRDLRDIILHEIG